MSSILRLNCCPTVRHLKTVIWCHGLGDSGDGFRDLFDQESQDGKRSAPIPLPPGTHVVLPNAPIRPITVNQGFRMRGWYDIKDVGHRLEQEQPSNADHAAAQDAEGILASHEIITKIIDEEVAKVGAHSVVLGGFSMGGAMTLFTGLQYPKPLAGLVPCSAYGLLLRDTFPTKLADHWKATDKSSSAAPPILAYHGLDDPMVPWTGFAERHYAYFKDQCGLKIGLNVEPGLAHSMSMKEIEKIGIFLNKILN